MIQTVRTFFLEMLNFSDFKPKTGFTDALEVKRFSKDVFVNWMLFAGVGLPWRWYSRLTWSMEDWEKYLENHDLRSYMAFSNDQLVGYFELLVEDEKNVEIQFFGLFPNFIGESHGGHMLSHAVDLAWKTGASRVWLHTCTSDHKFALNNYLARGFKVFKEMEEDEDIPEKEEFLKNVNGFFNEYMNQYTRY